MAFPTTLLDVTVELALGADLTADPATWAWTDATPYVRIANGITIIRGKQDQTNGVQPSNVEFVGDNTDGRWCRRYANGAWYGQLGIDTPVRVVVDEGGPSVRWSGFISSLPRRWDLSGRDATAVIRAEDIIRRLQNARSPLRSTLYRVMTATGPVAHWPCEDGSTSTTFASSISDAPAMRTAGEFTAGVQGPAGSAAAVGLAGTTQMHGYTPTHASTGEWSVAAVVNVPAQVTADTVLLAWSTSGSLQVWTIVLSPGSPDTLTLNAYAKSTGALVVNKSASWQLDGSEPYGRDVLLIAMVEQDGSDLDYEFWVLAEHGGGAGASDTATSQTAGTVSTVAMYPSSNLNGGRVCHIAAWDERLSMISNLANAIDGWDAEAAITRFNRLGSESGLSVTLTDSNSGLMGPQPQSALLDLFREVETFDGGFLCAPRDIEDAALALIGLNSMTSVDPVMTLDIDGGDLGAAPEPIDDDQGVVTAFVASRPNGSSYLYEEAADIPREMSGSFNVRSDAQLPDLAAWQVHLGTVDVERVPQLAINLASRPTLIPAWLDVDVGSRIVAENPLAGAKGGATVDDLDLLVLGYTEYLGPYDWSVTINCAPYLPYRVFQLAATSGDTDEFAGHLDLDSCVLAEALDTTETGVDVTTSPLWTTTADDTTFDILVGGERMRVTAVTGASNPQTLTVTRSVNGVVKSHSNGAAVVLAEESANYLGL